MSYPLNDKKAYNKHNLLVNHVSSTARGDLLSLQLYMGNVTVLLSFFRQILYLREKSILLYSTTFTVL